MDRVLNQPAFQSPIAQHRASLYKAIVGRSIELLCIGFYICLMYKLADVGIVILCLLIILGSLIRYRIRYLFGLPGLLSVLYLAMSTTTAFLVSYDQGVYRTLQFAVTLLAFVAISNYFENLDPKRQAKIGSWFVVATLLIFAHMILYHLSHGYLTTWKYLLDTKTTISIVAVILFLNEDKLRGKYGTFGWWLAFAGFAFLLLLSGERKAYILTAILFVLSRTGIIHKLAIGVAGAIAIGFFVMAGPEDSYIARQIDSLLSPSREMQISEFYNNQSVSDQSDLIREFVNQNAWQLFLEHPIMGLGANGYGIEAVEQFSETDRQFGLATNVHGEINRVPVEGGLVGIFIAGTYMLVMAVAVLRDFYRKGRFHSGSADRFPLYAFLFLSMYLYVEAMDTLMLSLIVLFGFHMAKVASTAPAEGNASRRVT